MGAREELLLEAVAMLGHTGTVYSVSPVYETQAWGLTDQPDFLNLVLELHTLTPPALLLRIIHDIEKSLGRERVMHWGMRSIDIDILFYGSEIINTDMLTVPHPHIPRRRFVLVPLADVAPDYIHPVTGISVTDMLNACEDTQEVTLWGKL